MSGVFENKEYTMRPQFTVALKSGINLDANNLTICKLPGGAPAIQFVCSGEAQCVAVEDIKEIRFAHTDATWCSECGQPLTPNEVRVG